VSEEGEGGNMQERGVNAKAGKFYGLWHRLCGGGLAVVVVVVVVVAVSVCVCVGGGGGGAPRLRCCHLSPWR
jgi:hypothetical protein